MFHLLHHHLLHRHQVEGVVETAEDAEGDVEGEEEVEDASLKKR